MNRASARYRSKWKQPSNRSVDPKKEDPLFDQTAQITNQMESLSLQQNSLPNTVDYAPAGQETSILRTPKKSSSDLIDMEKSVNSTGVSNIKKGKIPFFIAR